MLNCTVSFSIYYIYLFIFEQAVGKVGEAGFRGFAGCSLCKTFLILDVYGDNKSLETIKRATEAASWT